MSAGQEINLIYEELFGLLLQAFSEGYHGYSDLDEIVCRRIIEDYYKDKLEREFKAKIKTPDNMFYSDMYFSYFS